MKLPPDPKTKAQRNLNSALKSVTFQFSTDRVGASGSLVPGLPSNITITGTPSPADSPEVAALKATLVLAVEQAGLTYQAAVIALSEADQ
jgi:hypothetical protein